MTAEIDKSLLYLCKRLYVYILLDLFVHNGKMSISRLHGKHTEKGPRQIAWVAVSRVNSVHTAYSFYIILSHLYPLHALSSLSLSLSILTSPPSPILTPYPYFSLSLSLIFNGKNECYCKLQTSIYLQQTKQGDEQKGNGSFSVLIL